MHVHRERPCEESKKANICKWKKEGSGETNPANTLILNFQLPEPWENLITIVIKPFSS